MTTSQMFSTLTGPERLRLLRMMRSACVTNRIEAAALLDQPAATSGITAVQAIDSLTECASVVLDMYPDPKPLDGLVAAFDAEADRMGATMGQREDPEATKFYGYPVQRDGQWRKPGAAGLASCGHRAAGDGECDCAWWPERAPVGQQDTGTGWPA